MLTAASLDELLSGGTFHNSDTEWVMKFKSSSPLHSGSHPEEVERSEKVSNEATQLTFMLLDVYLTANDISEPFWIMQ